MIHKSFKDVFTLFVLLLAGVLSMSAQQVTKEAALSKATQFFKQSDAISRRAARKAPQFTLANNRNEFYVFNDEANGGYVVVSGDERMPDVLGYSYTGHFDAENIPCNMRAWLEDYANQVIYLRAHPEVPASRRSTTEREEISPLLKCHFGQGKYYNNKCPITDGEHAGTGCVATAMAQIMYYHQWPKQTTDTIPGYTTRSRGIDMSAIPVTTIDWENMLEQYNSWEDYSDKQIDAISTLMLLCGTSVEMDYNFESGASPSYAAKALRKYFNYNEMVESVSRLDMEAETWAEMLYDELKARRPVLYSGVHYRGYGHVFVLDGYRDGYFHVNWGWGGAEDNYFLLTELNGYTIIQGAVVGIQPDNDDYPSRYAVLNNEKLTFYYDKERAHRTGTILPLQDGWSDYAEQISECIIDSSFANLEAKSFARLFSGMWGLKSIQGLKYLNTSKALDMSCIFQNCSSLTSLDVSSFNTNNVISMSGMFSGCSSLTSLDVSSFNTNKVTNMGGMFEGCSSLTSLDVSGFNTNNVIFMSEMFRDCSSLTSLDVSGFKTNNVISMDGMFYDCSNLTTIYTSEYWDMSNVENADNMFGACNSLIGGAGTTYNSQHINGDYAHVDGGPENPGYFTYKAPPTGIRNIYKDKQNVKWYTLDGKKTVNSRKGLNIVRMSNGQVRKVVVK